MSVGKESIEASVLGQLLFLQSTLDIMPETQGVIDLVCAGLMYVPSVTSISYLEKLDASDFDHKNSPSVLVVSKQTEYGALIFTVDDLELFTKYKPHIQNVANSVALVLDNRGYVGKIKQQRDQLELRVNERTTELEGKHNELQRNERKLRIIADHAPVLIAQCDKGKRYKFVNQSYAELFGLKPDDLIGKHVREILGEESFANTNAYMDAVLAGKQSVTYDLVLPPTHLSTGSRVLSVHYSPEYDKAGHVLGFIAAISDVTNRRQIEDRVHELNVQLVNVFETMSDGFVSFDSSMNYTYVNTNAGTMLGRKPEDLIGKNYWQEYPEAKGNPFSNAYERALKTQTMEIFENYYLPFDRWFECRIYPSVSGLSVFFADITDRKKAADQVLKLSQAIEQAGESILITDLEGTIEYVNPTFTEMTGYTAEEAIGQTPRILNSGNQDANFYQDMWSTIASGSVWKNKVIDRKKDGTFYPTMLTISPIQAQSGNESGITHYVGIQSDLSKLEDLEQQFHQAQKMEALGTLVGGVAHDFNNMLAGITGNLYLAKKRAQAIPDVLMRLDNIEKLSFRSADMIQQLLTFARKDAVSMKSFPLTPFIKETLKLLRTSVPESVDIVLDICGEDLLVNGDGTQLHQVLMNLINNARDALEGADNPRITVRLESFHTDDLFVETHAYFRAGSYVHMSIEDNGCGIPEHQLTHLFEPFFTTKEHGKGTGLGLAMVFGAVKTHNGFVEVDSTDGEGSTFDVYIPLLETEDIASESERQGESVEGSGETILLVDDAEHILETGKAILESLGYQVLTATDGQQAIEIFEPHSEEIDLVILDVVMPVIGGVEAAQRMRRVNPHVKVIFSTGYDKNVRDSLSRETVLSKPFSFITLSQIIRQRLDG